jgi:quercetin dioxygenase-like cupin family protein
MTAFELSRLVVIGALTSIPVIRPVALAAAGPPTDTVTSHDVSSLPWTQLRPGIQIKPVVGQIGTFVFAEIEPRAQTVPHHHTHEQANLGLAGSSEIAIGGMTHRLAPRVGTVAPPDAEHFIANPGTVTATLLEFQPIRRLDLLPPRPSLTYLTRRTRGAEQFVYLVAGHAEVYAGSEVKRIGPGTLLMSAADTAQIAARTTETDPAVFVVFEAAPRASLGSHRPPDDEVQQTRSGVAQREPRR